MVLTSNQFIQDKIEGESKNYTQYSVSHFITLFQEFIWHLEHHPIFQVGHQNQKVVHPFRSDNLKITLKTSVFIFRDTSQHVQLLFKAMLLKQGSSAYLLFQPAIFPSCYFYFELVIVDPLGSFLFPHSVEHHTTSLLSAYRPLNFPDPRGSFTKP